MDSFATREIQETAPPSKLCESALSLVLNTEALPGAKARGGILTPATGLGEVLAERLRQAGMTIEVGVG
jgi:short subunit dehydrogenase-like uncharacterized protein